SRLERLERHGRRQGAARRKGTARGLVADLRRLGLQVHPRRIVGVRCRGLARVTRGQTQHQSKAPERCDRPTMVVEGVHGVQATILSTLGCPIRALDAVLAKKSTMARALS